MKEKVTVTAKVQVYLGEQERKQVVATGCLYRMADKLRLRYRQMAL